MFYVEKPDQLLIKIIQTAYPGYKGRKIKISTDIPSNLSSYWDGGSRNYYVILRLSDLSSYPLPSNHPVFEPNQPRELFTLPPGFVVVQHTIFCGKDLGITIYANSADLTPYLPAKTEISELEKAVLYYTRSLKSSYNGQNRQEMSGIEKVDWDKTVILLKEKGLLGKRNEITTAGKNAIAGVFGYSYKRS